MFDGVNINEKFNILNSIIEKTYFKNCQVKTKTMATQKLSKPWITPSLRRCIERKHLLHKNSLTNPSLLADFKRYRNTLRNLINTAKKTYYHNLFESATDMKTTWRRINSVVRPNRVNPKLKLKVNDELVTDSTEIASTFNNHFSSVAQVLNANIPNLPDDPTANVKRVRNSFVFLDTDAEEIYNIILSFKSKGAPINEVPSCIFRKIADIIAPVLSSLINEAVASGSYPNLFKVARVTPIHKAGSKFDFKNYRPISVLPFLNKVFERALHSRISKFYHKYNVIYEDQYGFLRNKSTTDAILKFTQECYSALNSKEHLISVFLDFSKAFDTICHDILIKMLEMSNEKPSYVTAFYNCLDSTEQWLDINYSTLLPLPSVSLEQVRVGLIK